MTNRKWQNTSLALLTAGALGLGGCISSDSDGSSSTSDTQSPSDPSETPPPTDNPSDSGSLSITSDQTGQTCDAVGVRVLGHDAQGNLVADLHTGDSGELDISTIPAEGYVGVVIPPEQEGEAPSNTSHIPRKHLQSWHEWHVSGAETANCQAEEGLADEVDVEITNESDFDRIDIQSREDKPYIVSLGKDFEGRIQRYDMRSHQFIDAEDQPIELFIGSFPRTISIDTPHNIDRLTTDIFIEGEVYDLEANVPDAEELRTINTAGELIAIMSYSDGTPPNEVTVTERRLFENRFTNTIEAGRLEPTDLSSVLLTQDSIFFDFSAPMDQFDGYEVQTRGFVLRDGMNQNVVYPSSISLDGQLPTLDLPEDLTSDQAFPPDTVQLHVSLHENPDYQDIFQSMGIATYIAMNDERYMELYEDNEPFMKAVYAPGVVRYSGAYVDQNQ